MTTYQLFLGWECGQIWVEEYKQDAASLEGAVDAVIERLTSTERISPGVTLQRVWGVPVDAVKLFEVERVSQPLYRRKGAE